MKWFFLVVLLGVGWLFMKLFLPYLTAIILAVVLAAVFHPVYRWISEQLRGARAVASVVTCILVVLLVVLPLAGFVALLSKEAIEFVAGFTQSISSDDVQLWLSGGGIVGDGFTWIQNTFGVALDPEQVRASLVENAKRVGVAFASSGAMIAGSVFGVLVQFVLMIIVLYYLLRDGESLVAYLMDVSPLPEAQERQIMRRFSDVGGAVFYGNIISSVLQGIVGGLGFIFFGLPGAFLWGSVMGILALIPLLGTMLVFIPASLFLFAQGEWGLAIGFLVYNILFANILDNWLKPKLIEKRLRTHPLLVFFSIIGGISAFGVLGLLYGPLVMTIFLALIEIYKRDFRDPSLASSSLEEGSPSDTYLG